ncbi:MAG TPA: hypothetical protein VFN87_12950 [Solirubrobacteraceae bacterium]|nr:hypothetical protein [Solirubrobacteraceae bacterium]
MMVQSFVALLVAPLLTAAATVATRRWGARTGGVVSAFPAIVGPVLVILALQHGRVFAARAAAGTLLGLVALAAFALTYARLAGRRRWTICLIGGWVAAVAASLATGVLAGRAAPPAGLVLAGGSLALAYWAMPSAASAPAPERRTSIPARMVLTAVLVTALAAGAGAAGPLAGGMLAALPVLASILAVLTHRDAGAPAAVALLRGMLAGMAGFVAFCEVAAVMLARQPAVIAFAAATAAALTVQFAVARGRVPPQRRAPAPG